MLFRFIINLFILYLLSSIANGNYCEPDLCPLGRQHIACGHSGRIAAGCNGRMINIRPYIKLLVDQHNQARNRIAGGHLPRFPPAVKMASMIWNHELARIAALNVLQCRMEHDQCRATKRFIFAGQNLAIMHTTARRISIRSFLKDCMNGWYNEHRHANRNDVEIYRSRAAGLEQIGHFTVMVNERNTHVGCAVARFSENGEQVALLACNYAVTNMLENPVYKFGHPASQCRSGRHRRYRNLCSHKEYYSYSQWIG